MSEADSAMALLKPPLVPPGNQRYRFNEERIQRLASIHKNLDEAVSRLLQDTNHIEL